MRVLLNFTLFFLLLVMPVANAQLASVNVLSKMEKEYDFKTNSIIQRLINTQRQKIEGKVMTLFEARCISSNIVDMLGSPNDERFTSITEKTLQLYPLSLTDKTFMEEVAKRYYVYMDLVAKQCTIENIKLQEVAKPNESVEKIEENITAEDNK